MVTYIRCTIFFLLFIGHEYIAGFCVPKAKCASTPSCTDIGSYLPSLKLRARIDHCISSCCQDEDTCRKAMEVGPSKTSNRFYRGFLLLLSLTNDHTNERSANADEKSLYFRLFRYPLEQFLRISTQNTFCSDAYGFRFLLSEQLERICDLRKHVTHDFPLNDFPGT